MPLRGSVLQAGTCQILSLAENPRWSRVWQKKEESAVLEATLATAQAELSLSWSWATVDQQHPDNFVLTSSF